LILIRNIFLVSLFCFLASCAHHRSGRYVLKNNKWVFVNSNTGFLNHFNQKGTFSDSEGVGNFIWPIPSSTKVSSFYGPRKDRFHDGIDIKARRGSHILAAASGKVIYSGSMRGYGKIIIIDHKNGYHSVYAHNSRHFVKRGQKVSQGEVIGKVGSTGRSTGPHLHFEIRKRNKNYNPLVYFPDLRKRVANRN